MKRSKTLWDEHSLHSRIQRILDDQQYGKTTHHMGRPFMSAYQIALEYRRRNPQSFTEINMLMGGKRSKQKTSFPQYIARELSKQLLLHPTTCRFEGGFLSNNSLRKVSFKNGRGTLDASTLGGKYPMSLFRSIKPIK